MGTGGGDVVLHEKIRAVRASSTPTNAHTHTHARTAVVHYSAAHGYRHVSALNYHKRCDVTEKGYLIVTSIIYLA